MGIPEHLKSFGVSKALDYLEQDPDANLPQLMAWVERFIGNKLFQPRYQELLHSAMCDPSNNWYKLIKSMYTDIDNGMLKKIFENFIIHGKLLEWPSRQAKGTWGDGAAPWAVLIDPSFPCTLGCEGCGAAIYGVRPEMEFDSLDEEIAGRKAKGTHLYIFSGLAPLSREQGIIALCNKYSDCVFAAITPPETISENLADDMLRVGNLFPAIRADENMEKADEAMALLRRRRLPFGAACRCTAENTDLAATDSYFDEMIARGAKFSWFFTCPAYGPERPASVEQLKALHQRVTKFRKIKPILTLDFCDGPSPAAVSRERVEQEGAEV